LILDSGSASGTKMRASSFDFPVRLRKQKFRLR
jgi:hypothetical protein